jgi:hypothetical protein
MKKLLLLFCFISFQSIFSQNILDFDLKNVELQGLKPAKINQEMKNIGIAQNPFVTDNPEIITKLDYRENSSLIKKMYTFIYDNPKGSDGGVVVNEFASRKDLDAYLSQTFEQSNYRVLVKNLFLIRVWSDYSLHVKGRETSEDHLNKMEKYYTNLGAKKVTLKVDESIITVVQ